MKCPNCGKSLWFLRDFCVFCKTALQAPPRPRSVAVVAWIAIVSGIGAAFVIWTARKTYPPTALAYADILIKLLCGAVMLRGMNWARWVLALYLAYLSLTGLVSAVANLWVFGLPRVILSCLAIYFLFRPAANAFFTGAATLREQPPAGRSKCRECGKVFSSTEMIQHEGGHICVSCKPVFLQKLREGVPPGVAQ